AAVVNKIDIAEAVNADVDAMTADVNEVNPDMPTFETSAEHGDGLDELSTYVQDIRDGGHHRDHGHGHEHTHEHGGSHDHEHEGHHHSHDHEHADHEHPPATEDE
ncbi:MAG: hypothetical protein ACOCS7_03250, partial [Halolamina sp.]